MEVRDVRDPEHDLLLSFLRPIRVSSKCNPGSSEVTATLTCRWPRKRLISRQIRERDPPRFANDAEVECARILDYHGIAWEYEPHSFILEQDEDGRVLEAFTPDFYLPEQDTYLEVTVMKQSLVTRKHRKIRKLRERHPDIKIKLFTRRDFERLSRKYRLNLAS